MQTAYNFASLSKAVRHKVGAVLVTKQGIVIPGVNGTVAGTDNACEERVWIPNEGPFGDCGEWVLQTKPTVLHAELNCILKAAKEGVSCINATLLVTLSPCLSCSAMIAQSGIKQVYYAEQYRIPEGVEFLESCGVEVEQIQGLF